MFLILNRRLIDIAFCFRRQLSVDKCIWIIEGISCCRHCVYILCRLSCINRRKHRHRNTDRHSNYILPFLFCFVDDIIDVAMWPTLNWHCIYILRLFSCLHRRHNRHSNEKRHRVNIDSTYYLLYCLDRRHCRYRNFAQHRVDSVSSLCALFLFTSSTSHCWSKLNRHRVYIVLFHHVS